MAYPKTYTLNDPKLKELLEQKGEVVEKGRAISDEILVIENDEVALDEEMKTLDVEIQALEQHIDLGDLKAQAEKLTDKFNALVKQMDGVKRKMFEHIKAKMPKEKPDLYDVKKKAKDEKEKQKEELEQKRMACGVTIQTFNDQIRPFIDRYKIKYCTKKGDDFETLQLVEGKVILTVVNVFDDFEKNFDKKKARQERIATTTDAV